MGRWCLSRGNNIIQQNYFPCEASASASMAFSFLSLDHLLPLDWCCLSMISCTTSMTNTCPHTECVICNIHITSVRVWYVTWIYPPAWDWCWRRIAGGRLREDPSPLPSTQPPETSRMKSNRARERDGRGNSDRQHTSAISSYYLFCTLIWRWPSITCNGYRIVYCIDDS